MIVTERLEQACRDTARLVGIGYDYEKNLLWDQEAMLLMELAGIQSRDGVIVEIGTYRGYSACLMGGIRQALGGKPVYTVDQSPMDSEDAKLARSRIAALGLQDHVFCINLPSDPATVHHLHTTIGWSERASLLFIDGDHTEEAVVNDATIWLPMVAGGGLVAFHDRVRLNTVDAAIGRLIRPDESPVAATLYLAAYMRDQFCEPVS